MERQFCINWPALVEEAKQRRKSIRLTQARLAKLAGVSTPTVSRFESGDKDIQLSTIMNILNMLGMNDKRSLVFIKQDQYYDPQRQIILFTGQDGNKAIQCAISKETLDDHFNGEDKKPLKAFQANQDRIEHVARRKYLAGKLEANGSVLLKTNDF